MAGRLPRGFASAPPTHRTACISSPTNPRALQRASAPRAARPAVAAGAARRREMDAVDEEQEVDIQRLINCVHELQDKCAQDDPLS